MHGLRIGISAALISMLQACSTPPYLPPHNDMAAKIYTDLALHYWQQGYPALATDRAKLALQQTPNYAPAENLLREIQAEID